MTESLESSKTSSSQFTRDCCNQNWLECRCPVPVPEDKDELLKWYRATLEFIASEEHCQACKSARDNNTINVCSKHRPAWILAKGALNGWTHAGGQPLEG